MKQIALLFLALLASCVQPCPCPCPGEPPPTSPEPTAEQFFGSCGFPWSPVERMGIFPTLRTYVAADFVSTQSGIFVEPIFRARTDPAAGLDSWAKALNEKGCTPVLCINQTPSWFGAGDADRAPVSPAGASRTDPASYAQYARIFGELAKRYGKNKFPPESLWVNTSPRWTNDPPNQRVSGLGLKIGFEVWNEPDKWWRKGDGSGAYFEPEEYAALFAACYRAVKSADSTLQVYNGGMTGFDLQYMERFVVALKALKCPMPDAFTVHHYSHAGNQLGRWPPTWFDGGACSPEADKDFTGVLPLIELAKANGRELWATEFGCDTRGPSWMWAKPTAGKTSEQLQSEWVVRTCLEYMRLGAGRAVVFNANDEAGALNGGLYANSGLLYGEGEPGKIFAPKPVYHALAGVLQELKGFRYAKDESTATARVLRFEGQTKTKWAFWSPTQDGRTGQVQVDVFTVPLTEAVGFVERGK